MKLRMIIFILAFAVISGCTSGGKTDSKVSLENVTRAMESQGLKLQPVKSSFDPGFNETYSLNKVRGAQYCIDINQTGMPCNLYIFVFDSKQAQIDGLKEYNEESKKDWYPLKSSRVYGTKNVFVVYTKDSLEKAETNKLIKSAVNQL